MVDDEDLSVNPDTEKTVEWNFYTLDLKLVTLESLPGYVDICIHIP